jgi:hypothetical protein
MRLLRTFALITAVVFLSQPAAYSQCANPVACENALPGTSQSLWQPGTVNPSLRGFAEPFSVNRGEQVRFYLQSAAPGLSYDIDIYRLGYYQGLGARKIGELHGQTVNQPACGTTPAPSLDPATDATKFPFLIDCGNWGTAAIFVTTNLVSGLFMARVSPTSDRSLSSQMFFVVRDDERDSDVLLQTSDTTWQAYNSGPAYFGGGIPQVQERDGHSVYDYYTRRAYKVSYRRPMTWQLTDLLTGDPNPVALDTATQALFGLGWEYSMIRFLEANGFDLSYFSGRDSDRRGSLLLNHRVFMANGHDEYWSGAQMTNILAARDAGVNLAFFTGNTAYWKIRWEDDWQTMVVFKEPTCPTCPKLDPVPGISTGLFSDPRFAAPAYDGFRPENQLTGLATSIPTYTDADMTVPEADGKLRFWRGTSMAALSANTTATIPGVLGFEIDGDFQNSFRPPGLFAVSTTELNNQAVSRLESGKSSVRHGMTLYRATSGALVFHAGSIWLQRAIAPNLIGHPQSVALQQAVINLLADMDVQPATLMAGLSVASESTDATAPITAVSAPAAGYAVRSRESLKLTGTASDVGGRVAGVEVSTDGVSWHPATGRESWEYAFTPCSSGSLSVRTRAIDDSGNIGPSSAAVMVSVTAATANDFVRNGQFECGFSTVSDVYGTGLRGNDWFHFANSGIGMTLLNGSLVVGRNIQRILAAGAGDGIGQTLTLEAGRRYQLRARIFVESGQAVLKIGKAGEANDVIVPSTTSGRWETLTASYDPTQSACLLVIYSAGGAATFKVDDVTIVPETAQPPPTANLLRNGDFSEGFDQVNDNTGVGARGRYWWHWANSGYQAVLGNGDPSSVPGTQRVQLSTNAGGYADGIGQHLVGTLTANTAYVLSARVYATAGTVQMKIGQLGAANDLSVNTPTNGTWHTLQLNYTTGTAQTSATVAFYGIQPGTLFYIDDASLSIPGSPPIDPPNLVTNGNFEGGFDQINDAWGSGSRSIGFWHWRNSDFIPSFQVAGAQGDFEQRIVALGVADGMGQHVALEPGRTYTLRATVHVESGQVDLRIGTLGAADSVHVYSVGTGTQTLTGTYTNSAAPGSPNNATLAIYTTVPNTTFRVDDISLRRNQ